MKVSVLRKNLRVIVERGEGGGIIIIDDLLRDTVIFGGTTTISSMPNWASIQFKRARFSYSICAMSQCFTNRRLALLAQIINLLVEFTAIQAGESVIAPPPTDGFLCVGRVLS